MRWQRLLTILRRMSPVVAALLLAALALRLIWRDMEVWSAPTFYALPLPLHIAGWLCLGGLWSRSGRRRAWLCLGMAAAGSLWWLASTRSLRREITGTWQQGPRIFFWNIGHARTVPAALHELIDELQPDAVALAESGELGAAGFGELTQRHPEFLAVELPDGVSCLVRGDLSPPSTQQLTWRVWVNVLNVTFSRLPGAWRLVLTDIDPWPPLPRDRLLNEIRAAAAVQSRTIIAGDFNTPLDAAGFDAWRGQFHHGFADCADWRGPLETWGYGVPVLAIDHIWMSLDLAPVRADKGTRACSDHSWLVVDCGAVAAP
jgi:endonuclease/exonuclease/phosphatase (EEP) superfamily protein YafD